MPGVWFELDIKGKRRHTIASSLIDGSFDEFYGNIYLEHFFFNKHQISIFISQLRIPLCTNRTSKKPFLQNFHHHSLVHGNLGIDDRKRLAFIKVVHLQRAKNNAVKFLTNK